MNVTMFMKWFKICSYLCFLFLSVAVLYILYTQPHLLQYSLQSEEQSVAEEEADSVPTGDVFFSNTSVSYVKEHSGALGRI